MSGNYFNLAGRFANKQAESWSKKCLSLNSKKSHSTSVVNKYDFSKVLVLNKITRYNFILINIRFIYFGKKSIQKV